LDQLSLIQSQHPSTSISAMSSRPPNSTLFPYTTLFRSRLWVLTFASWFLLPSSGHAQNLLGCPVNCSPNGKNIMSVLQTTKLSEDRKSTRLNSSHVKISYAVFCLKKKKYNAT